MSAFAYVAIGALFALADRALVRHKRRGRNDDADVDEDRGEASGEDAPARHWHGATHHVPGAGFAIMPRP